MVHKLAGLTAFIILSLAGPASAQLAPDVRAEINKQMEAKEFKAVTKTLEAAQEAGDESFETNELLIEAYFMRIDQVGILKKKSIAGKMKKALERSIEIQPKNAEAISNLAQYHIEAPSIAGGDKDEARRLIEKVIALDPVKGHLLGAGLAQQEKDIEGGMVHLDKALLVSPDNTNVLLLKSSALIVLEDYDGAIASAERCFAVDPAKLECLYQIGKAAQIGDVQREKGIMSFKSFLERGHENKNFVAHAHYRLGNLYSQSGDKASAAAEYDAAIKINDLKDAKAAKKKLN